VHIVEIVLEMRLRDEVVHQPHAFFRRLRQQVVIDQQQ
jgi:hypothetical protein